MAQLVQVTRSWTCGLGSTDLWGRQVSGLRGVAGSRKRPFFFATSRKTCGKTVSSMGKLWEYSYSLYGCRSFCSASCPWCVRLLPGSLYESPSLAGTKSMDGVEAFGNAKDSPSAAAVDVDGAKAAGDSNKLKNATEALRGTKLAGSTKDSPYAAAKDDSSIAGEQR